MTNAVFTIVQDEPVFLPLWLKHYSKFFQPDAIHVINHESTTENYNKILELQKDHNFVLINVYNKESFNHEWLAKVVGDYQNFLINSYNYVLFCECDEIIIDKSNNLKSYIENLDKDFVACQGWDIVQPKSEPVWDKNKPIMGTQRKLWFRNTLWDKPLLSKKDLSWCEGFHTAKKLVGDNWDHMEIEVDENLLLLHLHRVDFKYALEKSTLSAKKKWSKRSLELNQAEQNRIDTEPKMRRWFYKDSRFWEPIPENLYGII